VDQLLGWFKRINEGLAVAAGLLLLISVAVTLFDIVARPFNLSIGGTDELSGYAMAIATSWGISYALSNLSHVRIDLLRSRSNTVIQAILDALAMLCTAGIAVVIAYRTWPVLAKTIERGSTANTTLETPLWIPQILWFAGWFWFAVTACVITMCVLFIGSIVAIHSSWHCSVFTCLRYRRFL